jgi:outer membrane protein TolC
MKRSLFLVVLAALVFHGRIYALTMDEAVGVALENNHRIKQFGHLESSTRERVGSARSAFLPGLDLGYSYFESNKDVFFQGKRGSNFTAEATYNLFNGMSDIKSMREAESRTLASGYQRKAVEADIVLETRAAYIGVLRARRAVETAGEGVALLERQRRDASLFYREGLIAKNDLLKVEVELASARQDLLQAEGDLRVARKRLERVMGASLPEEEGLEDFEGLPEAAALSFEAMKEMVREGRSELGYLRALGEAQRYSLESIRGGYLPALDLSLSYTSRGDNAVPDGEKETFGSDARATVTASWNVFDGFRKRHDIGSVRYAMRATEEELRDTEEELFLQLREAVEGYLVAAGKLEASGTAVGQAEENYRVTENQFKQRVSTTTDLLDARFLLTRARNQYNNALYDAHAASARVDRVLERSP